MKKYKNSYIVEVNKKSNTLILNIYSIIMIVGFFAFTASHFLGKTDSKHNLETLIIIDMIFVVSFAIPNICRKLKVKEEIITHVLAILFMLDYAGLTYYSLYAGAITVWVMGGLLLVAGAFYLNRIVLMYASIGSIAVISILLILHPVQNITIDLGDHIGRFAFMGVMIFIAFTANAQYSRTLKENFKQYEEIHETNCKLIESEEKFHKIFASSPCLIIISSIEEGTIIDCNKTFLESFGYERGEVIGKTTVELNFWLSSVHRKMSLESLKRSGSERNFETDFRIKTGKIRHYIISGEIIVIDGVSRILTAMFDITEKKKAEEELVELKNELEERVNVRTEELQSALEEVRASNEELLEAGKTIMKKNIELEENYSKLVETQKQLVQKEKMAAIGQLAAGVAHELNNPLGYIISNTETLKSYVKKFLELIKTYQEFKKHINPVPNNKTGEIIHELEMYEKKVKIDFILSDVEELLSDTENGLERVRDIVAALRRFSHIDRSNGMTEYDLNEGINTTLVIANNEIKNIAVVEKEMAHIPKINVIGGEISQVILNLLINAIHAIKSKGAGDGKIKIATYDKDDDVFFEIEDNGIGMDTTTLNRIFEPFYTTKPIGEGTGLGLSLSYDVIVKKHKGEISVDSQPGVGTKFTIRIPINQNKCDKDIKRFPDL